MAKLTVNSTVREALQNPRAVALAEKMVPGITRHPALRLASRYPLIKITRYPKFGITREKLDQLLKEVNGD